MNLDVTKEEAQLIVNALSAQPFQTVYQLIFKLDAQIKQQDNTPAQSETVPNK